MNSNFRGIGLAITKILLETFRANVVALSRTRGAALQSLVDTHQDSLLALECDVCVSRHDIYDEIASLDNIAVPMLPPLVLLYPVVWRNITALMVSF